MRPPRKVDLGRWLEPVFGSLERRVVGALVLILLATIALQFISQNRAFDLRSSSAELRRATGNSEQAEQLVKAVSQFRLATRLATIPTAHGGNARAEDELTDAAIKIGEAINGLRLSGMHMVEDPGATATFADLDRHVGAILAIPLHGRVLTPQLEERNETMAVMADAILVAATGERDRASERLDRSVREWQQIVLAIGTLTIAVVGLILLDLLRNTLPALRRMHGTLRQLAAGDLDVPLETFRLRELQALSGPLEIFRRHALAVKNLAFTDTATGLPNRRAFLERAASRVAAGPRGDERGFLIAIADIDRFKHVNDDFGHAVGDRLVGEIGARMIATLGPEAIVARLGGDEFALCVPLAHEDEPADVSERLLPALGTPINCGTFSVAVTVSLGMVETPGGPARCEVSELLEQADLALHAAKHGGRNRACAFAESLAEERLIERALERDLEAALGTDELRMVYQPIHAVPGNTADAAPEVEALLRWRHPELGDIPPARLIAAAERSGQMDRLGRWILERALADLAGWPELTLSLNLSAVQLQQDGFVSFLVDCCRRNGIFASRVVLEVTESLPIERDAHALLTLELLRRAGFRIALDDFGTGYSSLCLMKTFRFDRLKLDRTLVCDLGRDPVSRTVFEAAVTMALNLGAEVVAEGVSEAELLAPVRDAGCTHVQGFHYSMPLEAPAVAGYYTHDAGAQKAEARRVA